MTDSSQINTLGLLREQKNKDLKRTLQALVLFGIFADYQSVSTSLSLMTFSVSLISLSM